MTLADDEARRRRTNHTYYASICRTHPDFSGRLSTKAGFPSQSRPPRPPWRTRWNKKKAANERVSILWHRSFPIYRGSEAISRSLLKTNSEQEINCPRGCSTVAFFYPLPQLYTSRPPFPLELTTTHLLYSETTFCWNHGVHLPSIRGLYLPRDLLLQGFCVLLSLLHHGNLLVDSSDG